jgi:hypothetical protein
VAPLRGVQPVVNGRLLTRVQVELISDTSTRLELGYTSPELANGRFGLELVETDNGHYWLRYWLADLPNSLVLDSFGVQFGAVENLRAYLRQGYTS